MNISGIQIPLVPNKLNIFDENIFFFIVTLGYTSQSQNNISQMIISSESLKRLENHK